MKIYRSLSVLLVFVTGIALKAQDGIPITEIKRADAVDFDKEILPALRQNCLACHNSTDAEGDIILESVAKIIESEAVVAGKPDESSLLKLSAHLDDPVMPPEDNEVNAKNLSSQQLGLIKLWISQGAKPSANSTANKVEFAALPPGVNPVYALSMSPDGQYLAAGRANQIFVYQIRSKQLVDRVTDPNLLKNSPYQKPGIAHLDIVQSLTFAPDNNTFVSGGFRNVKIWKKSPIQKSTTPIALPEGISSLGNSTAQSVMAVGGDKGSAFLLNLADGKVAKAIKTGDKPIDAIAVQADGKRIAIVTEKKKLRLLDVATAKPIGNEIALDQDAVSLGFVNGGQSLLVSLANNPIASYSAKSFEQDPKEKVAPERLLNGHGKPAELLVSYGENQSKLLTASSDGTAKTWNLANGQQVRTFSHGAPVSNVAISNDETRVATCAANGSLKIFDASNSALIKEVRGDAAIDFQVASLDRQVRLKQQLIDVAKADLDAANKEKTAEDANVKKTEEALKKADEELKAKLDAKNKADAAHKAANDPFMQKSAELAPLQKAAMDLAAKITPATELQKKLTESGKTLDATLKQAVAQLTAAKQKLDAANAALAKDANNADLKKAAEVAAQEFAKAEQAQKTAQAAKTQNDGQLKAATDSLNQLNTQKAEADKKVNAVTAEVKKMEPNVKKLADAQKKASDEHTAASRNQTLAKNSVERAKARAKKVADKIPVLTEKHKAATAAKDVQAKSAQDFKTANQAKLGALAKMVALDNNQLIYQDAAGNLGACDFLTGEKLDSYAFAESAGNRALLGSGNQVLSISADGKTLNRLVIDNTWKLAKQIGDIDDVSTFVDRVTSLDISADGKMLATGSGEPSRSGVIKIWNLENGALIREIKDAHSDTILDLKFSPDGTAIASGSSDRFMKTFNLADGKLIRVFEGHTHHVMGVDWNSTGRQLSSAGADKVVKVWDAQNGTQTRTIPGYGKEVTALRFVELSNNIITASGDKTVRMKRTDNGGEVRSFAGNNDFVYSVATTADGKLIAAGGEDSVVRVWSDNGQVYATFNPPEDATAKVSSK